MNLNFYPAFLTNKVFHPYGLNQSLSNKNIGNTSADSSEERRDTFTLSPQGNARNHLANLMKLKTELTDRKNDLLKTVKDGGSMDSIKSQLDFYNEQLENIDQQIADAMAAEMEKEPEKKEERADTMPLTEDELFNRKMSDLSSLSADIDRVDIMDSARQTVDGRITVLRSELSLDQAHRSDSSDRKLTELSELEKRSKKLDSEIGSHLIDIAEEEARQNEPSETEKSEEDNE